MHQPAKNQKDKGKIINTTKLEKLSLILITLFTALFIPINADELDTSENFGVEEIAPRAANSCGIDMHHVFPQKFKDKFAPILGSVDSINNYLIPLNCSFHRSISYQYYLEWECFFESNTSPTREQVFDYAEMLAGKFGYDWIF